MWRMTQLSDDEVQAALERLPGWRREGDAIERDLELPTFPAAIDLVVRIGEAAEAADHHPDIDIRWRTLHLALTTHDAGGLTTKDVDLALQIETAARDAGAT
jgi:4a-hydroxytetrahydrobiopterin dehydratase